MLVEELINNIDNVYTNLQSLSEFQKRKIEDTPTAKIQFHRLVSCVKKAGKHIDWFFNKLTDAYPKIEWNDYEDGDFEFENIPKTVMKMLKETEKLLAKYEKLSEESDESEDESENESESEDESENESESEEEEEKDE